MTKYLIALIIALSSHNSALAQKFQWHMGGGLLTGKYYSPDITGKSISVGGVTYVKAVVDFRHVQLGLGMELLMPGEVTLRAYYDPDHFGETTPEAAGVVQMLSLNGKIHFGERYFYGGGSTGMSIAPGIPFVMRNGDYFRMVNGLQLGYVFKWGKRLQLDISGGWRVQQIENLNVTDCSSCPSLYFSPITAHYLVTTVGMRMNHKD